MSFSEKINVTLPPDQGEKTTLGASRIRSLKRAICERLSGLVYGFKSDDTESDETKQGFWKVLLNKLTSSPTHEQDKGIVYVKEVDGKVELFYKDSAGNEKQITSAGKLNIDTAEAVLLTGDQTIEGVKTFTSIPVLPSSDPTSDYQVANKKYVDDNTTADDTTIEKASGVLRVKDSGISQAKLKTAYGEVSSYNDARSELILPGGEYGFYPVFKMSDVVDDGRWRAQPVGEDDGVRTVSSWTTYHAHISMRASPNYYHYALQRYITSSGKDHWIFLLIAKKEYLTENNTIMPKGSIVASYQAPDHPSANQSGATELDIPHPFSSYDPEKHEIVLVDNDILTKIKNRVNHRKSLLTIINEDCIIDDTKRPTYEPREIIKINEYSDQSLGRVITRMKTPKWTKILIQSEEITLEQRIVEKLPDYILYKSLQIK